MRLQKTLRFMLLSLLLLVAVGGVCEAKNVRISFVGDIMTHAQQLEAAKSEGGYDFTPQFEKIIPYLASDILVGNFETTLPGEKRGYSGYPAFGTPDSLGSALSEAGFNVLLLANNHIYDKGISGLHRTVDVLRNKGFMTTGAWKGDESAKPLLFSVNGIKIGLLNYSYGSNVPISKKMAELSHMNVINEAEIVSDIKYLREGGAQFIIATFHWGLEYQPKPSAHQKKIANACFDAGADLVIGAHPHILQPVEIFERDAKTRLVAYSLGNFISSQRTLPRERSVILSVEIAETSGDVQIQKVELAPTYVEAVRAPQRIARVIHAEGRSDIEKEILKFLGVTSQKDENGFYKIFER